MKKKLLKKGNKPQMDPEELGEAYPDNEAAEKKQAQAVTPTGGPLQNAMAQKNSISQIADIINGRMSSRKVMTKPKGKKVKKGY